MRPRNAAFTLLELVVVLAILAAVTALAVRSLDHLEDHRRFEASEQALEELSAAIIGSPDEHPLDDVTHGSSFLSDMGRLPKTTELTKSDGTTVLDLGELWRNPGPANAYKIREAISGICSPSQLADPQVLVPGGWRGPYLRLPMGAETLLDAWGNSITSPTNGSAGYAHLRESESTPLTSPGQEIRYIRVLGANGQFDSNALAYDKDQVFQVTDEVEIHATVDVYSGANPSPLNTSQYIVVRVFQPSESNPAHVSVLSNEGVRFSTNPIKFHIPTGVRSGTRAVRAYLFPSNDTQDLNQVGIRTSAVKYLPLRGGPALLNLKIDRDYKSESEP